MSLIIKNAVITRVDALDAATASGDQSWTAGSAIEVGATIDAPNGRQRFTLGATIKDATAVIYVLIRELPGYELIRAGWRIVASLVIDGVAQPAVTYEVVHYATRVFGVLSHLELFVKEAA